MMLLMGTKALAQHGINSLYSAYAIGDLEERDYSRNFGVGSTGIARRSDYFLNELNPASYSAIPRQHFMFDVSLRGQSINYKNNASLNQTSGDISIRRLAIGFKASNRWGISAGFTPYSTVNYKLISTTYIDGTGRNTTTTGDGGINKGYISNSFRLTKNFSVGVATNFLFGPINTLENVGGDTISTKLQRYAFNVNFNTGVQYTGRLGPKWVLGLGATYRVKTNMNFQKKLVVQNSSETTVFSEDLAKEKYSLPEQYAGGIYLSNGSITWLADWRRQLWSQYGQKGNHYQLKDADRYSTGFEYAFRRTYGDQRVEGIVVQVGAAYNKSYLMLYGNQIKDVSGSAGISIPSRSGSIRYYVGVEAGQRGTLNNNLIRENYLNAVFHFSLRDIWFIRRTYD
jgi:hypothetical protein